MRRDARRRAAPRVGLRTGRGPVGPSLLLRSRQCGGPGQGPRRLRHQRSPMGLRGAGDEPGLPPCGSGTCTTPGDRKADLALRLGASFTGRALQQRDAASVAAWRIAAVRRQRSGSDSPNGERHDRLPVHGRGDRRGQGESGRWRRYCVAFVRDAGADAGFVGAAGRRRRDKLRAWGGRADPRRRLHGQHVLRDPRRTDRRRPGLGPGLDPVGAHVLLRPEQRRSADQGAGCLRRERLSVGVRGARDRLGIQPGREEPGRRDLDAHEPPRADGGRGERRIGLPLRAIGFGRPRPRFSSSGSRSRARRSDRWPSRHR